MILHRTQIRLSMIITHLYQIIIFKLFIIINNTILNTPPFIQYQHPMNAPSTLHNKESKVLTQQPAFEGKWIGLKYITYSIGDRQVPNYESVYRTTTKKSGRTVDGVEVIPVIKYKDLQKCPQVVLIANFRPPVNKFVLQFPSGLLEDEDYKQNAKREVLQETGYKVESFIEIPSPVMHCDPWKSNQSGFFYIGVVNGDDPEHRVAQSLESEENIVVHTLDLNQNLINSVHKLVGENGYVLEGKVWSICLGLAFMNLIK